MGEMSAGHELLGREENRKEEKMDEKLSEGGVVGLVLYFITIAAILSWIFGG